MIQQWLIFYRRFKFLPITFGVGILALILRIEIAEHHARQGLFITTASVEADDTKTAAAKTADTKTTDKPADKAAAPTDVKADASKTPDAPPPADPLDTTNQTMRPSGEISILKDLADRRAQLEKREADLHDREALLEASQKQFDEKIKQLTDLRDQIKQLLDKANSQQDDETKRLIDVYEKMKPKDAAGIFSNMSMEILFPIVQGMKEAKLSPILAAMPPEKARVITGTLYEKSKVLPQDSPVAAAATAATNPAAAAPAPVTSAAAPTAPPAK